MNKKTIGIIGGMGPLATADLFKKIIMNTKAEKDQEHIKILIDNNTDIPDRTAAIVGHGESPIPQLTKSAVSLCEMGADFLIMPCNTAHYFLPDIQKKVEIPILSMLEATGESLRSKGIQTVGLLATEGTIKSGIYQRVFETLGVEIITPSQEEQVAINDLIYKGVKAGKYDYDTSSARNVMEGLLDRGAELLVLGCTELPVAVEMYRLDYPVCDPTLELARAAIQAANYECLSILS